MEDIEHVLSDLNAIHKDVHKDDPPPLNENQRHAQIILSNLEQTVMELVLNDVSPSILENSLFYFWIRLTTWNHGFGEKIFESWTSNMETIMKSIADFILKAEKEIKDNGPTILMEELGQKVQILRKYVNDMYKDNLSRVELKRQTKKAMRSISSLVNDFMEQELHPVLVEKALLYYWFRMSVLRENVSESFFQKMERNWDIVFNHIYKVVDNLKAV